MLLVCLAFLPWAPSHALAGSGDPDLRRSVNPYEPPNTQPAPDPKPPAQWELDSSFFDTLAFRVPTGTSDEMVYTATRNLLSEQFEKRNALPLGNLAKTKGIDFELRIQSELERWDEEGDDE